MGDIAVCYSFISELNTQGCVKNFHGERLHCIMHVFS